MLLMCAGGVFALVAVMMLLGTFISEWRSGPENAAKETPAEIEPGRLEWDAVVRTRQDLWPLLEGFEPGLFAGKNGYVVLSGGKPYTVRTSIDPEMQSSIEGLLARSQTLKAAVVVMDPFSGRILALADYSQLDEKQNLCLQATYPAASLIKIIAAAAAIETAGMTPETRLSYNGGKYTLYKSQLKENRTRYTHDVRLREAFAQSINPVFGKLGIFSLGQEILDDYAGRFMFNHPIPFDLPLDESRIDVPATHFGLAEIASGFNKRTLISPLHGALVSAAVANRGVMMVPWLVEEVKDGTGRTIYRSEPAVMARPIEASTARSLRVLMEETVDRGTCRRTIKKLTRRKRFKSMDIGAKTGTINDPTDTYKFDWLSAYAIDPEEGRGVCLAVMGMHGEKLGIRAPDLGQLILERYVF